MTELGILVSWAGRSLLAATLVVQSPAEVPTPALDDLDPSVRQQLEEARAAINALDEDEPSARVAQLARLAALYHVYDFPEAAEELYSEVWELSSNAQVAYFAARLMAENGRYEDELTWLERSLAREPGYVPARLARARALYELGRYEEALQAIEIEKLAGLQDAALFAYEGETALQLGRHQQAKEALTEALRRQPAADRLHYPLGRALMALGDRELAAEHLENAGTLGVRPADPWLDQLMSLKAGERVLTLEGRKAFAAGDVAGAVRSFSSALAAAPQSAGAHVNLGTALARQGELGRALQMFQRACALAPRSITAHLNLGELLRSVGRYDEAQTVLAWAHELHADDAAIALALARVTLRLGDLEEARRLTQLIKRQTSGAEAPDGFEQFERALASQTEEASRGDLERRFNDTKGNDSQHHDAASSLARSLALTSGTGEPAQRGQQVAQAAWNQVQKADLALTLAAISRQTGDCDVSRSWLERAGSMAAAESAIGHAIEKEMTALEKKCANP